MRWETVAPYASIALNVACFGGYTLAGQHAKSLYWVGATIINIALIMM
jgi:hypothetical protein